MSHNYVITEEIQDRWDEYIDVEGLDEIKGSDRKVLTRLMENTRRDMNETVTAGDIATYDPVLIPLLRRTQPSLVTPGLIGMQPMSGPTGLVFAMHVNYVSNDGLNTRTETWNANVPNKDYSGPMATADAEKLGVDYEVAGGAGDPANDPTYQVNPWAEMDFTISSVTVTAESRAMKARFTDELAQDLRAIHGADADGELVSILQSEVVAEQDREVLGHINLQAVAAGNVQADGSTAGTTHVNVANFGGRWAVEKYQMFIIYIDAQANEIARQTRRGRGNFIITSANVAGALDMAGRLHTDRTWGTMAPNTVGPAFVGVLAGKYKVYVDPYAASDYVTIGYKGANQYDAGLFKTPYVPLRLYRARGEEDFQPRIGFKTRYGLVSNPYYKGTGNAPMSDAGTNQYFRTFTVLNILDPGVT